jgi:endoglucanase
LPFINELYRLPHPQDVLVSVFLAVSLPMRPMLLPFSISLLCLFGCGPQTALPPEISAAESTPDVAPQTELSTELWLQESWMAYRQRFIQDDGRVIDWESNGRTVSEGQAYAMLRAVLADDPDTFEKTLGWAEDNLKRAALSTDDDGEDHLWAWKWGEQEDGSWGIIDANFASDADIDAITALILAARRWDQPAYLDLARLKLADLWAQSTIQAPVPEADPPRYLLPGPQPAFQARPGAIYINPSYLAPYAFRLFAQVDPAHDWLALVDSSYDLLDQTAQLSPRGLPGDWAVLDLTTQVVEASPEGETLQSLYGFDAYRVWWRVEWDADWFDEPRAQAWLNQNLIYLEALWQAEHAIPAVLDLTGNPLADYEATAQYAMLYPAFQRTNQDVAADIRQQKLLTTYNQGIWDNPDAYYVQNLAWLGLFPAEAVPSSLLREKQ